MLIQTEKIIYVCFVLYKSTECNFPGLTYQSKTSSKAMVTNLTFHPFHELLIAVWNDGVIRSWTPHKGKVSSQMSPHSSTNSSQIFVSFNSTGSRLLSAD